MEINAANLSILRTMVDLSWKRGLTDQASSNSLSLLSDLYREYSGTRKISEMPFDDTFPGFSEWVGDRVVQNVKTGKFVVIARNFERTVGIPLDVIEDDDYGIYSDQISIAAAMWPVQIAELIVEVLTANKLCFTGKAFIATDHKYGKNTINNKTTSALSVTTFDAAFAAVAGWKFANGKVCRTRFTHLYVGPKLEMTAKALVADTVVSGGAAVANPRAGMVKVVVLPDLAGDYDDYWFLADNSGPIKPIGLRQPKVPSPKVPSDYFHVERAGALEVIADGRAESFPSFPHLIYGGIL
jgi:hypothetical protein